MVDEFGEVLTAASMFCARNSSKVRNTGAGPAGGGGGGSITGTVPAAMLSKTRCMLIEKANTNVRRNESANMEVK